MKKEKQNDQWSYIQKSSEKSFVFMIWLDWAQSPLMVGVGVKEMLRMKFECSLDSSVSLRVLPPFLRVFKA